MKKIDGSFFTELSIQVRRLVWLHLIQHGATLLTSVKCVWVRMLMPTIEKGHVVGLDCNAYYRERSGRGLDYMSQHWKFRLDDWFFWQFCSGIVHLGNGEWWCWEWNPAPFTCKTSALPQSTPAQVGAVWNCHLYHTDHYIHLFHTWKLISIHTTGPT